MKYEALSDRKRLIYMKQFETMNSDGLWSVINECYRRIGLQYVVSEIPNEDYLNEQRDIARLAAEYVCGMK